MAERSQDTGPAPSIDLAGMRVFIAAVEANSFSGAARRLQITLPTVSKHIAMLERQLGAQLIVRSTRRMAATDVGLRFYERCIQVLEDLNDAITEVTDSSREPRGVLRIAAPPGLANRFLAPALPKFMHAFPKIHLEVITSSDPVDLVQDRFDLAIRISEKLQSEVVARRLAPYRRLFCAAPGYIQKHGEPRTPDALPQHNCVIGGRSPRQSWPAKDGNSVKRVTVTGSLVTNGSLLRDAVISGIGISLLPAYTIADDIKDGRLVEILKEYKVLTSNIYAVFPQRRNLPMKTRLFLDFLYDLIGSNESLADHDRT